MTNNSRATTVAKPLARPAFHIRRLRDAYGDNGLAPEELADLAGIPRGLLDALERCTMIPPFLDALMRVAFALQVPLAELIDVGRIARAQAGIARRRQRREGGERAPIGFSVSGS